MILSHSAKNFHSVGEHFSVSQVSGIEKIYASDGYVTFLCRDFFCLTVPENFLGEPFCAVFHKVCGREKVYA